MSALASVLSDHHIYAVWRNPTVDLKPKGGILLLADRGVAFQGLLKAAQESFPGLDIELASQLPAPTESPSPRLVLVHAMAFRNPALIVSQCHEQHPGTPVGLMIDGRWADVPGLRQLVAEKSVQGLLPFDMEINVWLATIWLLLNGGEYFPNMNYGNTGMPTVGPLKAIGWQTANQSTGTTSEDSRVLSNREGQVLELMSQGHQNKIIAVKMQLSEHTVKVHVHNVIRKLKVHNRTQAAAVYRSFAQQPAFGRGGASADGWLEQTSD